MRLEHFSAVRANGFTLLETLAALTILAIALSSLLGAFSTGLRAVDTSEKYVQALNLARSLLSEQSARRDQQLGASQGVHAQLVWRIAVEPVRATGVSYLGGSRWELYRIVVRVSWKPNREITLETLKLGERRDRATRAKI